MKFDETFTINKLTVRFQGETKYETLDMDKGISGMIGGLRVSYRYDIGQFDDSMQPVRNYATLAEVYAKLQKEIARPTAVPLEDDARDDANWANKLFKRLYTDYYAHNGAHLWLAQNRRNS